MTVADSFPLPVCAKFVKLLSTRIVEQCFASLTINQSLWRFPVLLNRMKNTIGIRRLITDDPFVIPNEDAHIV
ncbi:MAG: hypothetical protein RBG13Loki_1792 [Promethearchaeota archaeon CR_4]|nr:MAG: hypothetical protein RBG13Loki_1792 [Candidatus Lokiarchaeota archaeon CR_4]